MLFYGIPVVMLYPRCYQQNRQREKNDWVPRTLLYSMEHYSFRIFKINRDKLGDQFCQSDNEALAAYGLPYSKRNCETVASSQESVKQLNCTHLPFMRIKNKG